MENAYCDFSSNQCTCKDGYVEDEERRCSKFKELFLTHSNDILRKSISRSTDNSGMVLPMSSFILSIAYISIAFFR